MRKSCHFMCKPTYRCGYWRKQALAEALQAMIRAFDASGTGNSLPGPLERRSRVYAQRSMISMI